MARRFPFTDMPWMLMLGLVAAGLPRTVLADLDVVTPDSSIGYFMIALVPFAAWLAVAVLRRTRRPVRDFLALGVMYGLSLLLAHQVLWHAPGAEHSIPQAAIDFAGRFAPAWRDAAMRAYTALVSLGIGLVTGVVVAGVAFLAHRLRKRIGHRSRDTVDTRHG